MTTPARRANILPRLLACLVLLVSAPHGAAHDFWIAPEALAVAPGDHLALHLAVGHPGDATRYARNPSHVARFVADDGRAVRDVPGRRGRDPAGTVEVRHAGTLVVGYLSHGGYAELPGDAFTSYLREEGLEHVVEARASRGESQATGRELYVRCAKAIVRAARPEGRRVRTDDGGWSRRLGLPLELVPTRSPHAAAAGGLHLRLLRDGAGAPGVRVDAVSTGDPTLAVQARTGAEGDVVLALPDAGAWLVTAVDMAPAAPDGRPVRTEEHRGRPVTVDWTSRWASLLVEVDPAAAEVVGAARDAPATAGP